MRSSWFQRPLYVGLLVFLTGCATDVRNILSELEQQSDDVELIEIPFYPQVTDQCGPSALAAILNASGVTVTPEDLKSQIYIPGRQGSLQVELLAATRGYGRLPYVVDQNITALLGELQGGRPVLVLQNLGTNIVPRWHYAVVVGYLVDEKQFVLRSGDRKRHLSSAHKFIRSWQRAGYWGVLALQPGELPMSPDADKYIRSVAAIEATGDIESAIAGYHESTKQWPENSLAWLGMGNANYARGNLDVAERAYEQVLSNDSNHLVALNNLAQVQLDRGRDEDAFDTWSAALMVADPGSPIYKTIKESRQNINPR